MRAARSNARAHPTPRRSEAEAWGSGAAPQRSGGVGVGCSALLGATLAKNYKAKKHPRGYDEAAPKQAPLFLLAECVEKTCDNYGECRGNSDPNKEIDNCVWSFEFSRDRVCHVCD